MKIDIVGERALGMVTAIASLRKRRKAINATIRDYGAGLKEELQLEASVHKILVGLDVAEKTVTINDKASKRGK